jgi:hypothetical protein
MNNTMNDFVDYMFKVPLFHLQVRNWETKKEILLEMAKNSNFTMDGDDTVKSDFHEQLNNNTVGKHNDKVLSILKEEIEIFCDYFDFNYCKISNSWFEIANQGNHHGIHTHGTIGYSSVCYIDYNKDVHSPTKFVAPFHNFIIGDLLHYMPKVEEGSIIFFPSTIMHYTEQNNSKIERTILSFNLDVKNNESQRIGY